MPHQQLERLARLTPVLILVYFAIQLLIRVGFSANLETDEAQFVGHTDLALGYGNSHPPLYNWLVRGALELTGWHWPAAVALVKTLLLVGTYLLSYDIARRVTGRALAGLIVVASFMLLPQIVWKSQITLAHTVMLMFAVVATLHAVVLIVERGGVGGFLWFGLAAAIGALAKYNFFLVLVAILIAAASVPAIRVRLFTARLALSAGLFAVLLAPHLVWALEATQRAPVHFLRIAGVVALLMMTAWPLWIAFGREQLAYPYAEFARALPRTEGVPLAILASQEKYAANLAIRLADAGIWGDVEAPKDVAIVWRGKPDTVPADLAAELGSAYEPRGDIIAMRFPYANFSGKTAELNARLYARKP